MVKQLVLAMFFMVMGGDMAGGSLNGESSSPASRAVPESARRSFWACGTTCPSGYHAEAYRCDINCGWTCAQYPYRDNSVLCVSN